MSHSRCGRRAPATSNPNPDPNPNPNPNPNPDPKQERFRDLSHRRDTSEMLSATWKKQGELKKIELDIEKKV